MKKTLIALAALTTIGTAFAQSTITPYVRLDVGLQSTNSNAPGAINQTIIGNAGYNGSNFGVKTSTDLGGGLTANAQLEEGFDSQAMNTGFTTGTNRVAKVGLAGSWGAIDLGNVWGPYDNTTYEAMNYNAFSPYGRMLNAGAHGDNGNGTASGSTNGSIQYTTPTISGFNATFNYAPRKDATGQDISTTAFDVLYASGPATVAFAFEHVPTIYTNDAANAAGTNKYANAWHISGMYDLKSVLLSAALVGATVDGVAPGATGSDKDTGYSLSAAFPVGAWTPSVGIASVKTSGDNLNRQVDSIGAQALYALNKIATYYVGVKSTKTAPTGADSVTVTYFSTGLTLSF